MGPATYRRLAFVAALVLLTPIWCRTSVVAMAMQMSHGELVSITPSGPAPAPAIRRLAVAGSWLQGARPDHVRTLVLLAVAALLSLLRLVPRATVEAVRCAPSSLARRRHVIGLRAPPRHLRS